MYDIVVLKKMYITTVISHNCTELAFACEERIFIPKPNCVLDISFDTCRVCRPHHSDSHQGVLSVSVTATPISVLESPQCAVS